jgi:chitodextrinase
LNGQPFIPRGFNSIALLNSPWCTSAATAAAAAAFTPAELGLAKTSWGANTLRFQVSQPVLASANGVAYAQQIEAAVNQVLAGGFVVDISMQDQSRACGPGEPLPGAETEAAWSTLMANTALDADPAVMFELFNEPNNQPLSTPATSPGQSTWPDWLSGGRQIGPGSGWAAYVPVGHQDLVNFLRNTLNVPNILIADGASKAGHLEGMPLLQDPAGTSQIAYAVHPYVYTDGVTGWATRWGYLTATNAVLATEWNYPASGCGTASQQLAPTLLNYLRSTVNVGVLGHALDDFTSGLISDSALTPTQCGGPHPGGGMDFLTDYMSTFSGSGVPPSAPTGLVAGYGPSRITLTWTAAQDPGGTVAGYDVYRGTVRVGTATATTFTDSSIKEATLYSYTVDAFDTAGRRGALSSPVMATAPDDQPPTAPTKLTLTAGTRSITLKWTASADNVRVVSYRVYRATTLVATVPSPSVKYTNSGLKTGTSYSYHLVAVDAGGNASAASATVSAKAR